MTTANYINDLLYRYNCVIVPDFGGFVTNSIGAKINPETHSFYPPAKQITFNSHLKHNDGLLANYIASSENISFEKAATAISLSVIKWKNELQSGSIYLENIGTLSLNEEKQIVFEPDVTTNYLTSAFGLSSLNSSKVSRVTNTKPVIPITKQEERKKIPVFIKYAATAAILLTLGFTGYHGYENYEQEQQLVHQEKALEQKIQKATFVISNPLPILNLTVSKKIAKPFHVVAGAFQFLENAEKKVTELRAKGYDSQIIGTNKWGLIQVSFNSYTTRNKATNELYKIQNTVSKDAWLLVK